MWSKAQSMIGSAASWCTSCLGKFPMYAFSHCREASCEEFAAAGAEYCRECYEAEHTISHLLIEPCEVACRRRLGELLREVSLTAGQLGERLYDLDRREQLDQLETLQRVRARLSQLHEQRPT